MHGLTHLHEVAEKYGCLEHCSAYPFENYMQTIKKSVRSTKNPLAQIVRRLAGTEINADVQHSLPKMRLRSILVPTRRTTASS